MAHRIFVSLRGIELSYDGTFWYIKTVDGKNIKLKEVV